MMLSGRSSGISIEATSASISRTRVLALALSRNSSRYFMPLLPWSSRIPDRRRAGCARGPRECDRRRRDIPGRGESTSLGRRGNDPPRRSIFILPPSPPASPIVARPISLALAKAAMRLAELPLVEMPMSPSPVLPWAMTCRTNTWSNPMSLPTAEIIAMSATRLIAASAGRPAVIGCTNSTATCEASQLEPPLPIENRRPPRR